MYGLWGSSTEVRFFADRHAALDFHRRRGRGLQQASGPRGGSTARTERAAYVEAVKARLLGDEEGVSSARARNLQASPQAGADRPS
jgi:hypothetical protein